MKLKANFSAKGIPENDNCYIRAVATAMNIEYDEALMMCLEAGWDHGMPLDLALKMAVEREWTIVGCSWWHDGDSTSQKILDRTAFSRTHALDR